MKKYGWLLVLALIGVLALASLPCPECPPCPDVVCPEMDSNPIAEALNGLTSRLSSLRQSCDCSAECNPTFEFDRSYIQAPHTDVEYSASGSDVLVKDVRVSDFHGYSMQPTIFTGNKILVKEYEGREQLSEGVIVWVDDGEFEAVHRVKGLYEDYLVTQGDNLGGEEQLSYDSIKYVIVGVLYE